MPDMRFFVGDDFSLPVNNCVVGESSLLLLLLFAGLPASTAMLPLVWIICAALALPGA